MFCQLNFFTRSFKEFLRHKENDTSQHSGVHKEMKNTRDGISKNKVRTFIFLIFK